MNANAIEHARINTSLIKTPVPAGNKGVLVEVEAAGRAQVVLKVRDRNLSPVAEGGLVNQSHLTNPSHPVSPSHPENQSHPANPSHPASQSHPENQRIRLSIVGAALTTLRSPAIIKRIVRRTSNKGLRTARRRARCATGSLVSTSDESPD